MNNANISFQEKTAYNYSVNQNWQSYIRNTNSNFFDNNKLYLKAMQDYMTREAKNIRASPRSRSRSPTKPSN